MIIFTIANNVAFLNKTVNSMFDNTKNSFKNTSYYIINAK